MIWNTTTKIITVVFCVLIIGGIILFRGGAFNRAPATLYDQLLGKNTDFALGEGLLRSGQYDEAAEQFARALTTAEGLKEEGQLKYKIAISESEGSNPIHGITLLKEVAANTGYTPAIRAYSVQYIGHLLSSYNTKEINDEVFKDEPYKTFFTEAEGDYSLARRKLYEYASSIYVLGVPELRVARWYSREILRLVREGKASAEQEQIEDMKALIREKLEHADAYLVAIANDENAKSYVSEVLYRRADVIADLSLAGDTTFGDPEVGFKKALDSSFTKVGQESSTKVNYAMFLANKYGKERAADIQTLLKDFYQGTKYAKTNTVKSIRGEQDNRLGLKQDLLLLARLDPSFKEYLKSLGWKL